MTPFARSISSTPRRSGSLVGSTCGRGVGWLLATIVAIGSMAVLGGLPADAQAGTPVDAVEAAAEPLVAVVGGFDLDPAPVQLQSFWLDAPAGSPTATAVVVFSTAFPVPREPWRVTVSVGDPGGRRVRASLVSVGGVGLSGLVEQGDDAPWDDGGVTEVVAAGNGVVQIGVPVAGADPDAVVWVEAEATIDGAIVARRSPTFALVDLLGDGAGPAVGTSPYADAQRNLDAAPVALDSPGPTVQVVGRSLEVTTSAPVPTAVDGAGVVDVIDSATITQAGGAANRTDRIEIDRRTGEVRLLVSGTEPVVAVPGTTAWLVNPPSSTAPGAPATVTFDLEALNEAVGGPPFDRPTTRVAAGRRLALGGGEVLATAGVGATMAWFDDTLAGPAPDASTSTGATTSSRGALVAGAVIVVAVLAVVLVSWTSRRRRVAVGGRGALPVEALPAEALPAEGHDVQGRDHHDVGEEGPPRGDGPGTSPPSTEADPLAAFLADVDELSARVDRLGGPWETPRPPLDPGLGRGLGTGVPR